MWVTITHVKGYSHPRNGVAFDAASVAANQILQNGRPPCRGTESGSSPLEDEGWTVSHPRLLTLLTSDPHDFDSYK